jgi:hypothetical protein
MSSRTFAARLAALEALEASWRPGAGYVCLHTADYAALDDPATPIELRQVIAEDYALSGDQKLYIGVCLCWGRESCRVCADRPLVREST